MPLPAGWHCVPHAAFTRVPMQHGAAITPSLALCCCSTRQDATMMLHVVCANSWPQCAALQPLQLYKCEVAVILMRFHVQPATKSGQAVVQRRCEGGFAISDGPYTGCQVSRGRWTASMSAWMCPSRLGLTRHQVTEQAFLLAWYSVPCLVRICDGEQPGSIGSPVHMPDDMTCS